MTAGYKLVTLANGVRSVHSIEHRETFHPVIGPVAEAQALYVNQLKLADRMAAQTQEFVVWDVGLGAAANVLTMLRATRDSKCPVRIISFDRTLEPLQFAAKHADALGYFDGYEAAAETLLRTGRVAFDDGGRAVTWELRLGDFPTWLSTNPPEPNPAPEPPEPRPNRTPEAAINLSLSHQMGEGRGLARRSFPAEAGKVPSLATPAPHAILYDAFSPAKNPAMWTQPVFANLFRRLDPAQPCALATYSRSTLLRVSLLLAGFYVGAGHATGEKEETTIAANTPALTTEPLDATWLERARNSTSAEPLWDPVYRQARMSAATWEKLRAHPQFRGPKS